MLLTRIGHAGLEALEASTASRSAATIGMKTIEKVVEITAWSLTEMRSRRASPLSLREATDGRVAEVHDMIGIKKKAVVVTITTIIVIDLEAKDTEIELITTTTDKDILEIE